LIIALQPIRKSTTNDPKERVNQSDDRVRGAEMSTVSAVGNDNHFQDNEELAT